MKKTLLLILLGLVSQITFGQWSKGKGNGYYKLSAWYLSSDQHYTDTGDIDPNLTRSQFNINIYAEYGITDRLDAVAYVPFFSRVAQNNLLSQTTGEVLTPGESVNAFGDIELGVNYNIFKSNHWSASAKLLLGLPTGDDNGGSDGSFQTGDGEFNQYISGLIGYSKNLGDIPFYSKSYIGFNNRTQNFSDEFRFGLESGFNLFNKKVWLIGRMDVVKSLKNGSLNAQNNSQGSIFANNIEYVSLGAEASYYITKKFGLSFTFNSAVSGRIIAANPSIAGGIFLDIK